MYTIMLVKTSVQIYFILVFNAKIGSDFEYFRLLFYWIVDFSQLHIYLKPIFFVD